MNKVRKFSIILIIPFIIFSIQKVYSFYQTNYIIPNKFKAATYNVVLEEEFYDEFGKERVKGKSSVDDYTNPDKTPYTGSDYLALVEEFKGYL